MDMDAKVLKRCQLMAIAHQEKTIHLDQVGFISGMQEWFNICKQKETYHIKKINITTIGGDKVFDKLSFNNNFLKQIWNKRSIPQTRNNISCYVT